MTLDKPFGFLVLKAQAVWGAIRGGFIPKLLSYLGGIWLEFGL